MVRVADLTRNALHERRYLDRHEPAHGDHLGGECRDFQRHRLRVPAHLRQQMRRARAAAGGRILSALLRTGAAGIGGQRRAARNERPAGYAGTRHHDLEHQAQDSAKEAPTEPFKRAVGVCLRAIAGKNDLEVSFAAERPGLPPARRGCRSRRAGSTSARRRSCAAMPTRSRCGSPVTIRRCIASWCPAASRRARCSKRSSRRASKRSARAAWAAWRRISPPCSTTVSIAANSTKSPIAPTRRSRTPVAMLVRERLTGEPPPPTARKLVELWRPLIEERAGRNLDRLERVLDRPAPVRRRRPRPAR